MTPKQQRFIAEYLCDLNATQAAIRAGYGAKTANRAGTRLLSNAVIAGAIQKGQQKKLAKIELTAERILEEIRRVALSDIGQLFDERGALVRNVRDLPPEVRAVIASIEVVERTVPGSEPPETERIHKIRLWDKGKHWRWLRSISPCWSTVPRSITRATSRFGR